MGKEITTATPERSSSLWTLSTESKLTQEEKFTLTAFFLELKTIFGTGKYEAQFGKTKEDQLLCMRGWAPMILRYTDAHLAKILAKVRRGVTSDHWINIPEILDCIDDPWDGTTSQQEHLGLTAEAWAEVEAEREERHAKLPLMRLS